MKELEEFFKNIKRIADGIEFMANDIKNTGDETKTILDKCNAMVDRAIAENNTPIVSAFDIPQAPVETVPQTSPVATGLPVSNTVEVYTQDQLATAMGRAVDAGKMADIQKIMADFGVASFVELPQERYNDLVLKLKEIGVDV